MIIEDYTDLLSHSSSLGYQDTQKISLKIYSPDLSLFLEEDLRLYINLEYIPWKVIEGVFYVAAVDKTDQLLSYLIDKYQSNFIVILASRREIFRFIQLKFSDTILEKTKNHLYKTAPLYSAYNLLKEKHINTIWFSVFIIIMLIAIYPANFYLGWRVLPILYSLLTLFLGCY
jgi:hypothetical protein